MTANKAGLAELVAHYGKVDVGFSKYSLLVLLAVALIAALWRFGKAAFSGATRLLLWALAVLSATAGLVFMLSAEGRPLPILGGLMVWMFAIYTIKVAGHRGTVAKQRLEAKKIPRRLGMGLKIPSLRWIREGQTLSAGDAEATRSE